MSAQDTADTTLMRYLRNEGLISYPARDIRIYTNAHNKLVDLFHDIDNAKRKVWIEYLNSDHSKLLMFIALSFSRLELRLSFYPSS